MVKKVVILASGNGTNAERIISYFSERDTAKVILVISNNPNAGVLGRCQRLEVDTMVASRDDFYHNSKVLHQLLSLQPDVIVLAGFLWLLPKEIVSAFHGKIVNIHPALLPDFGGKGMYGHHVHEAVLKSGQKTSGITIHLVNEKYDEGDILFQAKTEITAGETPESLAKKIHQLEHTHFPVVIEQLINEA